MRASTLLLAPLFLLLSACSTAPQRLDLKPTIDVTARNIGQGTPLRERPEDIPLLLDHFFAQAAADLGKKK